MSPSTLSRNRIIRSGGIVLGFLVASGIVLQMSWAAFSSVTDNDSNSVTAGTVLLTDDDSAAAMFSVAGMVPGDVVVRCIRVTSGGTVANPGAVKLYSGGYTDSSTLGSYLNLTVDEGTGGTFADCTGFGVVNTIVNAQTLVAFDAARTSYANGVGVWDPATTPETITYRFTIEMDPATPNTHQGESVTNLTFVWEIQS